MPISPLFKSIYEQEFEVDYFDCDINGNIKISDFCKLIQMVASNHAVVGGISYWDLQSVKQAWVINKFRLEIEILPKWQDTIKIVTWIQKLDGIRSTRNFEVYISDRKIAKASSLWVILNTERRRPEYMKLPHDHFIKYSNKTAITGEFYKFKKDYKTEKLSDYTVKYSDLDMVKHVTNIKYIEWIIDVIKEKDIKINDTPCLIDMVFQKELLYKESCVISQVLNSNQKHFIIQDAQDNINFQCIIE
ncbi:acyl-[acyl-carrier-protein] thioesterase [Myroides injenensis]|uniref:acyl-[acyl-carrier-protein] thioesterase n=1 Tax=Myroides injenensis TaxID=1183151 RepID=UPI000287B8A7|nr:acyl-ACP thioesterase domain-containing protein [Myroides injenensis]